MDEVDAAIILLGPHGLGDTQQYERELAFVRQTRDPAFPVVPVILPGATIDPPANFLRLVTWIDFSPVATVSEAPEELEHLLASLRNGPPSRIAAHEDICPYRGLDQFREEDSLRALGLQAKPWKRGRRPFLPIQEATRRLIAGEPIDCAQNVALSPRIFANRRPARH